METTGTFLDEKLYNHVKNFRLNSASDFSVMMSDLYLICEEHYKPRLSDQMSSRQIKSELDKVFKSWELMVSKLKAENYLLWDFVEKGSYKQCFLSDSKLSQIYSKL
jgi:hypothetical protein